MKKKIEINKPNKKDLDDIKDILSQWTDEKEVDKYIKRINNEIRGKTKYNMQFWAIRKGEKLAGVIGLSDPLPKILFLAKTKKPAEIKILYIKNNYRRMDFGKKLVNFIEEEAKKQGYFELIVRSAVRYKETAFGFYERLGYSNIGEVSGGTENKIMKVFDKLLI